MTQEESNLDFLTIHLQPHLWPWKGREMNRQTLEDSETTATAMEENKGGQIEETGMKLREGSKKKDKENLAENSNEPGHILTEGKHFSDQKVLSVEGTSFQYPSTGKTDTFSDENTRMAEEKATSTVTDPFTHLKKYPGIKVVFKTKKTKEELMKDELLNVLADLKAQGESSGHMNMKVPTAQLKRVVELENLMEQAGWNEVWSKFHDYFEEITWRYWKRSIKAQLQQTKLIEGWKLIKNSASDELRTCMKLLQAEEYWPVFSGIKYKTYTNALNLIREMQVKNNGNDYKELCRLIPPKLLQHRLSRMEYMSQRPKIISNWYSYEEIKLKQEQGYDTLLIMMIEEALDIATQLESENWSSKMKDKKIWEVFAKLFRVMGGEIHGCDEVDDTSITGHKNYKSTYWPPSIECELFTCGSTPQSHRFRKAFHIALRNLGEIKHIYKDSMNDASFFRLIRMAGDWSLADILLGVHNGVDLKTFKAYRYLAKSNHHPYIQASKLDKEKLAVKQVYNFQRFLHARMELKKEGKISFYRPLESLRVL
ncbi:uncharacterized protein MELLADRAFT_101236 [Melampsora larici-populina 98AG31]|uniref:Uncharacterized protein n=1 Tax=Melampsora larici-populina (strain 98AG31 / pathotype 3-4-7) TaxID=747676 RepID=F4R430_MELLP|nr:uncharacterized protein MELLADRAFT_101236 [Melampsora larici-populina 98AG31]EGG13063.1 hypothetical protein MELLADRAFT_101236 [Melampsora larici-populina 98AG31]